MSWIDRLKSIIIVCLSVGIAFICIEIGYRILKGWDKKSGFIKRTMLFESGDNFKNYKDFFKYYPNISIRSLGVYSKVKPTKLTDLVIEYDYIISTNNAGLVMKKNLKNAEKVVYIIGDSFTEGQGANPWFYKMEEFYDSANVKLVNLGILGTGPVQWNNLENYITQEFNLAIKGSVINIIPGDMTRAPWTFKEKELMCLQTSVCTYIGGFQGLNLKLSDNNNKIKKSVLATLTKEKLDKNFKDIIKQSHVILDIYRYMKNFINNPIVRANEEALLTLKRDAKDKVFVNIVSQKSINSKNFNNYTFVKDLIEFLEKNKFNFKWCDIPIDGFHKHDGHPNEKGYATLQKCTEDALKAI